MDDYLANINKFFESENFLATFFKVFFAEGLGLEPRDRKTDHSLAGCCITTLPPFLCKERSTNINKKIDIKKWVPILFGTHCRQKVKSNIKQHGIQQD